MKYHGNIPDVTPKDSVGSEKLINDGKQLLEGMMNALNTECLILF